MAYEFVIDSILYSDNKELQQLDMIHHYLSEESYWAKGIPLQVVKESIEGSICFGAYLDGKQIAHARLITDGVTFGYLADVFVLVPYRGKGISKQLMQLIMDYPMVKRFRRFMLATNDAQGLYSRYGFKPVPHPDRIMQIKAFESYTDK